MQRQYTGIHLEGLRKRTKTQNDQCPSRPPPELHRDANLLGELMIVKVCLRMS
jgi:hypothetical protein